jgi:hypothetical protein
LKYTKGLIVLKCSGQWVCTGKRLKGIFFSSRYGYPHGFPKVNLPMLFEGRRIPSHLFYFSVSMHNGFLNKQESMPSEEEHTFFVVFDTIF